MNQLVALSKFLIAVLFDPRIGPVHISMYAGLLKLWHDQEYRNPIIVNRRELMPLSKIYGLATYHCKIRELHEYGYITYSPSFNHYEPNTVLLKLN